MFARIISVQTTADPVDDAIQIAKQQLPGARSQQGYQGFYVLADRASGKLMTISLWDSHEDLHAVEARAAQVRAEAAQSLGRRRRQWTSIRSRLPTRPCRPDGHWRLQPAAPAAQRLTLLPLRARGVEARFCTMGPNLRGHVSAGDGGVGCSPYDT